MKIATSFFLLFFWLLTMSAPAATFHVMALSWLDQSNNEWGFAIERRIGQTGSFVPVAGVPFNSTQYFDPVPNDPPGAIQYCYRAYAWNVSNSGVLQQSAYTNVACATTPASKIVTFQDGSTGIMMGGIPSP